MAKGTQKPATIQDIYEVLAGNALQGRDGLVKEMRHVKKELVCVKEELEEAKKERAEMKAVILKIQNKPTVWKGLKYIAVALKLIKPAI